MIPLFGDDRIQQHIVRGGGDALDLLKGVGQTDQPRRVPDRAPAAEGEGAIVVAAARAEAHAAAHRSRRAAGTRDRASARRASGAFGLGDAEAVAAHGARASSTKRMLARRAYGGRCAAGRRGSRARGASAMSGAVSSSSGSGGVERDARAAARRVQRAASACARDAAARARARSRGGARRGAGRAAAARRVCGRRSVPRESGSVTRLCRCEPLLSNQSNKWDELRQVRLSARGGLAQCCPQALCPVGVSN